MSRRRKESIDKEGELVDVQLTLLRAQESDYQRILDDIFARKHAIAGQRRELEARRRELDRQRQPIHWIPPELLIHIFLFAVTRPARDAVPENEPFHRSPVVISHVCSRWRSIALGVSRLWACISVQSSVWSTDAIVEFLKRSLEAPLDVVFALPPSVDMAAEFVRAEKLFAHLDPHYSRIRSLSVQTRGVAMQKLVLNLRQKDLYALQSLNLCAVSLMSSSPSLQSLNPTQMEASGPVLALRHLRLDKLPLYNIPTHFLANLVTLELAFPPKKSTTERLNSYMLRLSHLLRFLRETPKLEELVLLNTVPYVDVSRGDEEDAPMLDTLSRVTPIELPHLRSIDWAYPFAADVHYFLSFFILPALESIDIGVEEFTMHRPHVHLFRGYPETAASQLWNRIHHLPALRSVSIQCVNTDSISSVLRKFTMPTLSSLDLAFHDKPQSGVPPVLPRMEALLRDPRLPFLTRLALARFSIPADSVTAWLGYLPALEHLALTACVGAPALLVALQGARVCPQLAELKLELCDDVRSVEVLNVVRARNIGQTAAAAATRTVAGRVGPFIVPSKRPMKKLPRQAQVGGGGVGGVETTDDVTSRMLSLTLQQQLNGSRKRICVVCLDNCAKIDETVVDQLKELGVQDVVWIGP
ncbi:hypothetical protein C8F01DRAFT_1136664 [Mycena amicta]|nr:hypothetical protein C8F01DRAFT_1136664 [Mycena amicta]